ncbi:MAG: hypothetical protein WC783_04285 [Candidatus Paceibacterota bacterium]
MKNSNVPLIISYIKWLQNEKNNEGKWSLGGGDQSCPLCVIYRNRDGYCGNCPLLIIKEDIYKYSCYNPYHPYQKIVTHNNKKSLIRYFEELILKIDIDNELLEDIEKTMIELSNKD